MSDYGQIVVLIIDDDKYTRTLIKRMLAQIGVRSIVEAEDGGGGYHEVLRTRPTMVFCDVHMAPVGGRAFLQQVRESRMPDVARTPVVFLTADAHRDTVLFAKEHAINGYLVKPVSLNDLKSRIDAILAGA